MLKNGAAELPEFSGFLAFVFDLFLLLLLHLILLPQNGYLVYGVPIGPNDRGEIGGGSYQSCHRTCVALVLNWYENESIRFETRRWVSIYQNIELFLGS